MSTSTSPPHTPNISADALAAAAERRTSQLPPQPSAAQLAVEHERRQSFRRLIDPGILRPNSKEQASASLKTLLTIAENLLREPNNPKYQQFKPTNNIIKRNLMDPKGTLEYAIELGFRPEVKDFQPYYTFNPRHMKDLQMGTAILHEFVDLEHERAERAARSMVDQKAVAEAIANQVKLAYMDDRKTKMLHDQREKERRAAREAAIASHAELRQSTPPSVRDSISPDPATRMPGSGHTLSNDGPPPYEVMDDED
ncbi:hypothetical protein Hypma_010143 [Hypsizygus marmoreus]|uniref:PUB domain-containing protein n=1 Tax=Hypsizygus marmoreus TaxID=39966 RepID=A0A369JSN0_HYPMA|nr:hypothetical protein Hypma_010143 [Hypsizygus marmoreus]